MRYKSGFSKGTLQMENCHRCGSNNIVTDIVQGEICCKQCGFVITQKFESIDPEWRNYDDSADKKRTGDAFSLSIDDFGLSTLIDSADKDSHGFPLSRHSRELAKRIRVQDSRSRTAYSSINSKTVFSLLDGVCDKLGLTHLIKEDSAYIYRKAIEKKLTLGRASNSIMAASIFIACRRNEVLRTMKDVSAASDVRLKRLSQSYKSLVLGLELTIPMINQVQYISKIASNLKLSEKTKRRAINIFHNVQKSIAEGRDPISMAAAIIYLACELDGNPQSQKKISDVSGISQVTIRTRYRELQKKLDVDEFL